MCVYMYVCMYVCIYIYIYILTYINETRNTSLAPLRLRRTTSWPRLSMRFAAVWPRIVERRCPTCISCRNNEIIPKRRDRNPQYLRKLSCLFHSRRASPAIHGSNEEFTGLAEIRLAQNSLAYLKIAQTTLTELQIPNIKGEFS